MDNIGTVARGPFAGIKYSKSRTDGTKNRTKILGTYETEIHPYIYDAIAKKPDTIINIGAGDGYYSVGFSSLFPNSKVIAYENAEHERQMHNYTSEINNIKNCELRGKCTVNELLDMNIDNKTLITFLYSL